jgi:hypothetical protein
MGVPLAAAFSDPLEACFDLNDLFDYFVSFGRAKNRFLIYLLETRSVVMVGRRHDDPFLDRPGWSTVWTKKISLDPRYT